jgi:uncharacterized glyoxalase superfamily protein PhnB
MTWMAVDPVFVVADVDASIRWYAELFGFESRSAGRPAGAPPLAHAVLSRDEVCLHLVRKAVAPHGLGAPVQALFRVDAALDQLFEAARARGATVLMSPADQPWGHRDFMVTDPDRNIVWVAMPIEKR